jgi:hypothetical protein
MGWSHNGALSGGESQPGDKVFMGAPGFACVWTFRQSPESRVRTLAWLVRPHTHHAQ